MKVDANTTLSELQQLAKLPVAPALAKQRCIQSMMQSLRVEGYIVSQEQAEAAFDKVYSAQARNDT
jgi:hypothetical protein